jgi:hypothetical protein
MENRIFFPQTALDAWVIDGRVELAESELTLRPEGRRYQVSEAVHVVREVTGTACPYDLVGRVKRRLQLLELGAELMDDSMLVGDNAYDVVAGWVAVPSCSFSTYCSEQADREALPDTDEALLQRFAGRV